MSKIMSRLSIMTILMGLYALAGCRMGDVWDHSGNDQSRLLFFPDVLADPISVVSKSNDEVIAIMKADKLHLAPVRIDSQNYYLARIAGFEARNEKGAPEVPHVRVLVKIPSTAEIKYEIIQQKRNDGITLAHDLAFQNRLPIHGGKEVFASRDESAYRKTYASSPVVIEEVSFSATEKVAVIKFMPLYYDASRKYVQLTTFLKVRFYHTHPPQAWGAGAPVAGNQPGPLSNFIINKPQTSTRTFQVSRQQPIDLVIAAESHRATLARYLNFKRSIGRQVIEKYVSGQSANDIKELIASAYRESSPPSTTMLVGNIEQIPSFRGTGDNTWTDWNYTLLDAGNQPDVALGRVPAHNDQELNIFIDKAIARETSKRDVDEILLTSGKDRNMRCAENASEVGRAIAAGNETINMTHHSMLNGANQTKVIDGYNSNPNFIVYDGHGYQEGMVEIPLLIRDLEKLRNTSYPIILDIACLNANWKRGARARNFAESILFSKTGGAAGIFASGGSGYGHDFFRDIGKVMAAARKAKGRQENEIGHVILAAKSKTSSLEDKTFWNYYGDPASSVWESNSMPSNNIVPAGNAPTAIFAKLDSLSPSRPVLYASANNQVDNISYCVGDRKNCTQASSFLKMRRNGDVNGMKVFKSNSPIELSNGMAITIWAYSSAGGLTRTIIIRKK